MDLSLDIQIAARDHSLPATRDFERWVRAALRNEREQAELCIRIVEEEESRDLNARYRDRDKPTNVLSFPADLPAHLELPWLGDLVVCAPVVAREAGQQGKAPDAHWAHMIVHGTLHLLGYDHIEDSDAEVMEGMETDILVGLNYPPPYDDPRDGELSNIHIHHRETSEE